jgi:hypothetical protein
MTQLTSLIGSRTFAGEQGGAALLYILVQLVRSMILPEALLVGRAGLGLVKSM